MQPSDLVEIELIKQLKYRYVRAVDLRDWDLLESCLTQDCEASYDGGENSHHGREAILAYLGKSMRSRKMISAHHVHHPEITLTSDTEATGVWALQDHVFILKYDVNIEGFAYYNDMYRKVDGEWKIANTGYRRVIQETHVRGQERSVTKTWFD